jgi:hypothetical protein
MIPFSLVWGGFAIFWEIMALGIGFSSHRRPGPGGPGEFIGLIFPLWGIPFVVAGLYMIFGRFFYDAALRKTTWFGVTNQRLIVLKGLFGCNVASFDYATLTNLNLVERGDGSGDILFGSPNLLSDFAGANWTGSNRYRPPGFYQLTDVRRIFNLIRAAQNQVKP